MLVLRIILFGLVFYLMMEWVEFFAQQYTKRSSKLKPKSQSIRKLRKTPAETLANRDLIRRATWLLHVEKTTHARTINNSNGLANYYANIEGALKKLEKKVLLLDTTKEYKQCRDTLIAYVSYEWV